MPTYWTYSAHPIPPWLLLNENLKLWTSNNFSNVFLLLRKFPDRFEIHRIIIQNCPFWLSTLCAKSSAPELFPLVIWLRADRCSMWSLMSDHKLSFPDVQQAFTNENLSDVEIATKACPARAFSQTNMMIGVSGSDTLKTKKVKKKITAMGPPSETTNTGLNCFSRITIYKYILKNSHRPTDSIAVFTEDKLGLNKNKLTSADLLPHPMAFSKELFFSNGWLKKLHIIDSFLLFFYGILESFLQTILGFPPTSFAWHLPKGLLHLKLTITEISLNFSSLSLFLLFFYIAGTAVCILL